MRLDSVREYKALKAEQYKKAFGDDPTITSFFASTETPMPSEVALGIAQARGDYRVAVRTADAEAAKIIVEEVKGEADVRLIRVAKRNTGAFYQGRRRPLEAGSQIQMQSKNFVGTLGCFVRDAAGVLYALTNSHVAADEGRSLPGHPIGQPFEQDLVGTLARFIPFSLEAPNICDAALVRMDKTTVLPRFNGALGGDVRGVLVPKAEHLGLRVLKAGRTTGARSGVITVVELDGLPVGYDRGVIRFNDQIEISGGLATDFSAPGDSGSLVVTEYGKGIGLLFAGGKDSTGEDFTYANPLHRVLADLGVTLA